MKRCHDLAGFFDVEMAEVFPTYVMYMRNLHTGMWGDWNFPRPVDLTAMTPVEAWIALQTTPIEKQGQASRPQSDLEHAMAEIDPEAAANLAERPVCALSDIACEMLKDDLETPLTEERAWDIMLVSLLLMHPSFDPASAGVTGMPSWDADPDGRWWRTRSFPMSVWRGRSSNEEILCELACRAARMVNPESMSWSVSPRSAEDLQRFAEELLSGEQLAQVIRQLVKASEGEGTALDVVGQVITRTQLCEIAGAMSTDTFKRIRDHTALTPLPKGTRDIIYTRRHVRMLIEAAIKKADGKQDWITAARRWQEWLDGGVSAEPTK